jgi:hypothetical protein
MTIRILALVLVVAIAAVILAVLERRKGPAHRGLQPGVTVVTAGTCQRCGPLILALRDRGIAPSVVDVSDVEAITAVPTVLITAADGTMVMRRSGHAALQNFEHVVRVARGIGADL